MKFTIISFLSITAFFHTSAFAVCFTKIQAEVAECEYQNSQESDQKCQALHRENADMKFFYYENCKYDQIQSEQERLDVLLSELSTKKNENTVTAQMNITKQTIDGLKKNIFEELSKTERAIQKQKEISKPVVVSEETSYKLYGLYWYFMPGPATVFSKKVAKNLSDDFVQFLNMNGCSIHANYAYQTSTFSQDHYGTRLFGHCPANLAFDFSWRWGLGISLAKHDRCKFLGTVVRTQWDGSQIKYNKVWTILPGSEIETSDNAGSFWSDTRIVIHYLPK